MVHKYELSQAARIHLDSIYLYTLKTWGQAQAEKYLDGALQLFSDISSGTVPARPIAAIVGISGYFTPYEKHFVYWRVFEDGVIGILAILHQQQDQSSRLTEALKIPFG